MEMIRLKDALELMDMKSGDGRYQPFDVKFVTANRSKKTGGEIIEIKGARKCVPREDGRIVDRRERKNAVKITKARDPRHFEHATRNLILANGQQRKIHIWLILEFNHKKVIL